MNALWGRAEHMKRPFYTSSSDILVIERYFL